MFSRPDCLCAHNEVAAGILAITGVGRHFIDKYLQNRIIFLRVSADHKIGADTGN
jgi:hypothetical protein